MRSIDEIRADIRAIYKRQPDNFHVRNNTDMRKIDELMTELRGSEEHLLKVS